ncbi:UDP-galactose transporter Gms1 [Neophaeococcomyces mojaviensis]|uniref:UDP-galactose transporter Gms1 n=1 Tax=Neophaeococcomyces mojaviensis TaxID=3383035 RepID=A0ACC3AEF3_9EURO|nr:UDP-galactose transporter Gms1 [Knufia sp. JES_112]
MVGLLAVAIGCLLSGLAAIIFEFILKRYSGNKNASGSFTSMWLRNGQLSIGGSALALCVALVWNGAEIRENGFFYGYTPIVWAVVLLQAWIGIVVALVIAFADNILKGFATSLSVLLSTIVSVFLFDFVVTRNFIYGTILVLISTHMYGLPDDFFNKKSVAEPETELLSEKESDYLDESEDEKQQPSDEKV